MGDLQIHIDYPQIIVNMPGTRLTVTYQLSADKQSLVEHPFWTGDDRSAPISLNEFRKEAWWAARKKAQEVSWISSDALSSFDKRENGLAASAEMLSMG